MADVLTSAPPTSLQQRYASRVKARLARPAISVADARDGILDCFLATYYQGVELGLRGLVGVSGGEDEVARITAAMFRRRLKEQGVSFEAPTLAALADVKDALDRELHVGELPPEIRGVHDQVCTLLLAKAEGTIDHHGARSAVAPARPAVPTANTPAPPPEPGVAATLREALARHLEAMARAARAGQPARSLGDDLARARLLIEATEAFPS